MDTSVRTQTKISVSKKGGKITIKEVITTTTTKRGMMPEVKVVEKVKEYDENNIPEDVKLQLRDLGMPEDDFSKKVRKSSSQGWVQGPTKTIPQSFEKRLSSVPPATQIDYNDFEKLNKDCVQAHNAYRQRHGVPPLAYSKELADYAQNWAEELAINQRFEHRKEDGIGENLYMFFSSNPTVVATAGDACDSWYSEIKNYKFGKEPHNMSAGSWFKAEKTKDKGICDRGQVLAVIHYTGNPRDLDGKSLGGRYTGHLVSGGIGLTSPPISSHFTQMIWKESTKVGMGRARGPTGKQIIVANYLPPGNFIGSFSENVPKPLS